MEKEEKKDITIADVAEALGVSKTTVSRAISGKGRIGKETRKRVLEYIEEHDYKPNAIAKGLAQSKTYNICVVMPRDYEVVDWNFFQRCLFGIQEMAETVGYDILLTMCQMNDISSLERIVANHKVDGVILMRTFLEDAQIDDNRIAAEVVLFSDKICNDEETVRLHSHIQGMKDILQEKEGVGRKMDFMAQEMNREANTILSKSNDLQISNIAIDLKTDIEKIREQIQNIE